MHLLSLLKNITSEHQIIRLDNHFNMVMIIIRYLIVFDQLLSTLSKILN